MAHHRFPVQPHDSYDGPAVGAHNDFAEDAQRPRDQKRNGATGQSDEIWITRNVGHGNEFFGRI